MPNDDVDLLTITKGTVAAPAGCGKTHLIAGALARHRGRRPVLVLTHTNAGVAALRSRLDRAQVSSASYRLSTIDGWAMRLISTFPARSGHDPEILSVRNPKEHYPAIRRAAAILLRDKHINDVLEASYSHLIVDEYQDCSKLQHAVVVCASRVLTTCILGDPMQAIFGFQGNELADWDQHVLAAFPLALELRTAWRWINAGEEMFGRWLLLQREKLVRGERIDLTTAPDNVSWVQLHSGREHDLRLQAARTPAPGANGTVLIIADSTNPAGQRQIASQTPGAVTVENVDLRDLTSFAESFDLASRDALARILGFASAVMTNVGSADLLQRVQVLRRGTERIAATDVETAALRFSEAPTFPGAATLLAEISRQPGVRTHRPAILRGCLRALQLCSSSDLVFRDAAIRVREESRLIGRPIAARTVGSTLLLKGLEADVAVILNAAAMDKRHLYVAMTRGAKRLVICSDRPDLAPTA